MTARDNELLGEIREIVGRLDERFGVIEKVVRKHEIILEGPPENGKHPGLKERVGKNEDAIADFKKRYARIRTLFWSTVGAAIVAVISATWSYLMSLVSSN